MSDQNKSLSEEMSLFFDARAFGYDEHMRESVESFEQFYSAIADPIEAAEEKIRILDLGCGTGLEFDSIFRKAPNALVTGIDISGRMLSLIQKKYRTRMGQIELVRGSYLTFSFPGRLYDYIISVMAIHHHLPDEKTRLYRRIRNSLKEGGKYIEGDYVVPREEEWEMLEEYHRKRAPLENGIGKIYHIDIPFSIETQERLLDDAGFSNVTVIWKRKYAAVIVAS